MRHGRWSASQRTGRDSADVVSQPPHYAGHFSQCFWPCLVSHPDNPCVVYRIHRSHAGLEECRECFDGDVLPGHAQGQQLPFIIGDDAERAVQHQEDVGGDDRKALVAVLEGMILDESPEHGRHSMSVLAVVVVLDQGKSRIQSTHAFDAQK